MLHLPYALSPYPYLYSTPPLPPRYLKLFTYPMSYLHIHASILLHHCPPPPPPRYLKLFTYPLSYLHIHTSILLHHCPPPQVLEVVHLPYVLSPYPYLYSTPPLPPRYLKLFTYPMSYLHIHTSILLHHCPPGTWSCSLTLCLISISIPLFYSTTAPQVLEVVHLPYVLSPYPYLYSTPPLPPRYLKLFTYPMSYLHIHASILLHHCPPGTWSCSLTLCLISISMPLFYSTTAPQVLEVVHLPYVLSPYPYLYSTPPLPPPQVLEVVHLPYVLSPYPYLYSTPPLPPRYLKLFTHPMSYLHIHTSILLHHCPPPPGTWSCSLTLCLISISMPLFYSTTAPQVLEVVHSPYVLSPYPYLYSTLPLPPRYLKLFTYPMSYLHIHTSILLHHCPPGTWSCSLTLCLISISIPLFYSTTAPQVLEVVHLPYVLSPYPYLYSTPPLPPRYLKLFTYPMSYLHIRTSILLHHCPPGTWSCSLTLCLISISIPLFYSTTAPQVLEVVHLPYVLSPYPCLYSTPPLPPRYLKLFTYPMSYLHIHTSILLHHCPPPPGTWSCSLTLCLISISIPLFYSTTAPQVLEVVHLPYVLSPYPYLYSTPPLPPRYLKLFTYPMSYLHIHASILLHHCPPSQVLEVVHSPYVLSPYPCLYSTPPLPPRYLKLFTYPMSYLHIHTSILLYHCPPGTWSCSLTLCLISISIPLFYSTTAPQVLEVVHSPYALSPYPYLYSTPPLPPRYLKLFTYPMSYLHIHTSILLHHCPPGTWSCSLTLCLISISIPLFYSTTAPPPGTWSCSLTLCLISISIPLFYSTTAPPPPVLEVVHSPYALSPYPCLYSTPPLPPRCLKLFTYPMSYLHIHTSILLHHCPPGTWSCSLTLCLISISMPLFYSTTAPQVLEVVHLPYVLSPYPYLYSTPPLPPRYLKLFTYPMSYLHIHTSILLHHCPPGTWSCSLTLCLISISIPLFYSTTAPQVLEVVHSPYVLSPYPYLYSTLPLPPRYLKLFTYPMSYLHIHTSILLHHCPPGTWSCSLTLCLISISGPPGTWSCSLTLCLISISIPLFYSTTAPPPQVLEVVHLPYVLSPYPCLYSTPPLPPPPPGTWSCSLTLCLISISMPLFYSTTAPPPGTWSCSLTLCLISISIPLFYSTTAPPPGTWSCSLTLCLISISIPLFYSTTAPQVLEVVHLPYVLSPYPYLYSTLPLPPRYLKLFTYPMPYLHIHTSILLHHCPPGTWSCSLTLCLISISIPLFYSTTAPQVLEVVHLPYVLSPYPYLYSTPPLPPRYLKLFTYPMSYLHIHASIILYHCPPGTWSCSLTLCLISISIPLFYSTTAPQVLEVVHSPYVLSPYPYLYSTPPLPPRYLKLFTYPMSYLHIHTSILLHHCPPGTWSCSLTLCLISISMPLFYSTTAPQVLEVVHLPYVLSPYPYLYSTPPLPPPPQVLEVVHSPYVLSPYPYLYSTPPLPPRYLKLFTYPMSYLHIHASILLHHCPPGTWSCSLTLCLISISIPLFYSTTAPQVLEVVHLPYVLSPYPCLYSTPPLPPRYLKLFTYPMSYLHIHTSILLHHCPPPQVLEVVHLPYVLSPYPCLYSTPPLPPRYLKLFTYPMPYLHIHTSILLHHCPPGTWSCSLTLCLISISIPLFYSTTAPQVLEVVHLPYVLSPYPCLYSTPPLPPRYLKLFTYPMSYLHIHTSILLHHCPPPPRYLKLFTYPMSYLHIHASILLHHCPPGTWSCSLTLCLISISIPLFYSTTAPQVLEVVHLPYVLSPYPYLYSTPPLPPRYLKLFIFFRFFPWHLHCLSIHPFRLFEPTFLKPGLYFESKSTPYTHTILRTWGTYSRAPMPIYAAVIAQMPSINTPTIRQLLRGPFPAFWSSADLETWMLNCQWQIIRDLCVHAGLYATYKINPSPRNGTQTAIAYVCVHTRRDLRRSINAIMRVSA